MNSPLSNEDVLQSPVCVLEAKEVAYKKIPSTSCKVIDLGRRTRVTLRSTIAGSPLDEVLNHLGMRPMQKREAWNDHIVKHPEAVFIISKGKGLCRNSVSRSVLMG